MNEPLSTYELARASGLSQSTVSRALRVMPDVIRLGAGRSARASLLHSIGNHGTEWPLFLVNEQGELRELGILTAMVRDRWRVQFVDGGHPLYRSHQGGEWHEGWPWFLDELRPQGFMGQAFVKHFSRILGATGDLNQWGSDEFLQAAYLYGADLPGNLMIGDHPVEPCASVDETEWPEMARQAIRGNPPGSSAAGERPKFTSGMEIVKYARLEGDGIRWGDLLVAEHIAGNVLRGRGIPAANSRIIEGDGFRFLAARRFDRTDNGGRRAMHSLAALDSGFLGEGSGPWPVLAKRLHTQEGLIGYGAIDTIRRIWDFGEAIGNNDMHLGNLSFLVDSQGYLNVAPVYDMLPARYSPNANGVPSYDEVRFPPSRVIEAGDMAREFWKIVEEDPRISQGFRQIARLHAIT